MFIREDLTKTVDVTPLKSASCVLLVSLGVNFLKQNVRIQRSRMTAKFDFGKAHNWNAFSTFFLTFYR